MNKFIKVCEYYCRFWFNRIDESEDILKRFPNLVYSIGYEGILECINYKGMN